MSRLSQHGGFSEEAIEKAKAQMAESLEFAEQQEPLARNGAGYPSTAGFIEQHFNFEEGALDFARCQRPDGSFYGTGGVCRKGSQTGAKEKEAAKAKAAPKAKAEPKAKAAGGSVSQADVDRLRAEVSAKQKAYEKADKEGNKVMGRYRQDPQNQQRKDELRVSGVEVRNARDMRDYAAKRLAKAEKALDKQNKGVEAKAAVKTLTPRVRELDKAAKAADKRADAADKAWRKSGSPKGEAQRSVRALDKTAKAANKEADRAAKALAKARKTAGEV